MHTNVHMYTMNASDVSFAWNNESFCLNRDRKMVHYLQAHIQIYTYTYVCTKLSNNKTVATSITQ